MILKCLDDEDVTIRHRALDLVRACACLRPPQILCSAMCWARANVGEPTSSERCERNRETVRDYREGGREGGR